MVDFPVTQKKRDALLARMDKFGIREGDLEEQYIRGSGRGGQKKHKTSSCVRLLHRPTRLEVKCQKSRSQALNRFFARRELCELFERRERRQERLEAEKNTGHRRGSSRGSPTPDPPASLIPMNFEMFRRANAAERGEETDLRQPTWTDLTQKPSSDDD